MSRILLVRVQFNVMMDGLFCAGTKRQTAQNALWNSLTMVILINSFAVLFIYVHGSRDDEYYIAKVVVVLLLLPLETR